MEVASFKKGKRESDRKNDNVETIIREYFLKQNLFDPKKTSSPNRFMKKLEKRMDTYYNGLYNSFILSKK